MKLSVQMILGGSNKKILEILKKIIKEISIENKFLIDINKHSLSIIKQYKEYLTGKYKDKDLILKEEIIKKQLEVIISLYINELINKGINDSYKVSNVKGASYYTDNDERTYINEINKYSILTIEEEKALILKIKQGDENARKKFIESNLRLVASFARQYTGRGIPFLDLVQQGNLGLIKAIDRFDISKGSRFSTYATWWIKQAIMEMLCCESRTYYLPVHVTNTVNKLKKVREKLTKENNCEPTVRELSKAIGIKEETLLYYEAINQQAYSLNAPISDNGEDCLIDSITYNNEINSEEAGINCVLKSELIEAMDILTKREKEVLIARFGIYDGNMKALEEVGQMFGVTRERIRQIEKAALEKLGKTNYIKNYHK